MFCSKNALLHWLMQKLCHKGHDRRIACPGVLCGDRVGGFFPFYQTARWRAFWLRVLWRSQAASLGFIPVAGLPFFAGFALVLRVRSAPEII